jgi:hypothetical protein
MPSYAVRDQVVEDDARCSKCRRTQDLIYFIQYGRVYKTCNECRDRDKRRRQPRVRITYSDSDDETFVANAPLDLSSYAADVPDINDVGVLIAAFDALTLSSSAAAASSSSANYFVDEPDPEPEP